MSLLTVRDGGASIQCSDCGRLQKGDFRLTCEFDGAPLRVVPTKFAADRSKYTGFAKRFAHILPLQDSHSCRESASLHTQLLDSPALAERFGIGRLLFKNECDLPTGTTKARMAAGSISYMFEKGVRDFVVVSTGNSTSAMTRLLIQYPEMRMHAFAGKAFVDRHRLLDMDNVFFHAVGGDFVSAGVKAKEFATNNGFVWEGGFFNPVRRISLATAYLEACDEIGDSPHWYVQAVSSAMGLVGVGEMASAQQATSSITRFPRLVGVQQNSCCPMVRAFQERCTAIQQRHIVENPKGVAKAILRGDPTASYPIVRQHILSSRGNLVAVSKKDILESRHLIESNHHIRVGGAAAAAFASVIRMGRRKRFRNDEIVLVNLTGKC